MAESITCTSQTILQKTLECPVCLLMYDKVGHLPKSLRCGHTVCASCVDQVQTGSVVKCPECRIDTEIQDVSTNFTVRYMLDALCSECRRKEREDQCQLCDSQLCHSCFGTHLRVHSLRSEVDTKLKALTDEISNVAGHLLDTSQIELENIRAENVLKRIRHMGRSYHTSIDRWQRDLENKVENLKENNIDSFNTWKKDVDTKVECARKHAKSSVTKTSASSGKLEDMVRLSEECTQVVQELKKSDDSCPTFIDYDLKEIKDAPQFSCSDIGEIVTSESDVLDDGATGVSQGRTPDYKRYSVSRVACKADGSVDQITAQGIAVSAKGYIIVTDSIIKKVKVYDKNLKCLSTFGGATGEFHAPKGVAVAPDGKVYVSDGGYNRIQVLTMAGHNVAQCDVLPGVTGLNQPCGVAFDKTGNLYICDTNNHRVQVVQQDGTLVRTIGTKGTYTGQFEGPPVYVAVTEDQKVLVSETASSLIKVFDSSGTFIETYPKNAPLSVTVMKPRGLATDHAGNIIIADQQGRLVVLNKDGGYVCTIESVGNGAGKLQSPEGVTVDADDNVIVSDTGTKILSTFTL